jgi:DNA (cytosine-5)-methyltransferase 1
MKAYYNDNDKAVCEWIRQLIADGLITPGDVDERSITEVGASELVGYNRVHFFAGICGWEYALKLAGWGEQTVWTGSCPCQPFSTAGKQKGQADERHLWPHFARLIRECRPPVVFGEQVASAVGHGWLDGVCSDLEAAGYACGAVVLGAHSVHSPHIRQRLFWLADAERAESRCGTEQGSSPELRRDRPAIDGRACRLGHSLKPGLEGHAGHGDNGNEPGREHENPCGHASTAGCAFWRDSIYIPCGDGKARRVGLRPAALANGIPAGVDCGGAAGVATHATNPLDLCIPILTTHEDGRAMLLKGYGNAIVPQVAAVFIRAYLASLPPP